MALFGLFALFLLGIALSLGFQAVPEGFSPSLAILALLLFALLFLRAVRHPVTLQAGHPTQFHGEVLFLVFSFFLLLHPYLLVILGAVEIDTQSKFVVNYRDMSNKALIASMVLLVGFTMGTVSRFRSRLPMGQLARDIPGLFPVVLLLLEVAAIGGFFTLGGAGWLQSNYNRQAQVEDGLLNHVFQLATLLSMAAFASGLFGLHRGRVPVASRLGMAAGAVWALALMMIGDRNSLFLILTVIFSGLGLFFLRVRLGALALLTFLALTIYDGFEKARRIEGRSLGAVVAAIVDPANNESLARSSLGNTTAVVRAGFGYVPAVVDHTDGRLFAIALAGVVPKIRGPIFGDDPMRSSSSAILTRALLGANASYGVGTSIVSDLYIDLGIWFVLFGAFLLGRLWGWLRYRAERFPEDHDSVVLFLVGVAVFAELPRYGFAFAVRPVAWTMLLLWGTRLLSRIFSRAPYDPPAPGMAALPVSGSRSIHPQPAKNAAP
ncbi:hypothetical protein [Frigidibacter sp. ROC022]|uniref:hypothetical protein n=1 Tax=Frigidibacter sp. ROC022 TaxID=2971796 RepID=UPI00215A6312|nr:hypothetical protein [Frigidibacter sp. ROC022]MCR8724587.1 hypothetical protein [Frigidibacter sp. ROC022]